MSEERILVAHGKDFSARNIEKGLEREDLNVVGVVSNHKDILAKVQETKPNVLVINTLWDSMGFEAQHYSDAIRAGVEQIVDFHKWYPDLRIVVYTSTMYIHLLDPIWDFALYLDSGEVGVFELAETIKRIIQ